MAITILCNRTVEDDFKRVSSILIKFNELKISEEKLDLIILQIQSLFDKKDSI